MSRYDWEASTIKLPTAEFARVRKAVEDADRARTEEAFELTQQFWKGLTRKQQTDPAAYDEAVFQYVHAKHQPARPWGPPPDPAMLDVLSDALQYTAAPTTWEGQRRVQGKPRRILKTDLDTPTNRTTKFSVGEARIAFDRDKSTVTYHSGENNHQVERARSTSVVKAFFAALDDVRWTGTNTGGVFVGNDEYNEQYNEGYLDGDAAIYTTDAFGPVGAEQAPFLCRPFTDSKGRRHTKVSIGAAAEEARRKAAVRQARETLKADRERKHLERSGGLGTRRQPRGTPVGGQFAGTHRPGAGITLR